MQDAIYIDSINGSNENDGSEGSPKKSYDAVEFMNAECGKTYLFKRGTEQVLE